MDHPRDSSSSAFTSSPARLSGSEASSSGPRTTNRHLSIWSVAMLIILIVGVATIVPTLQKVVAQQQQINATQASIEQTQARIDELRAANKRWQDPAYVKSQARARLYLVVPGQEAYITLTDGAKIQPDTQAQVAAATQDVRIDQSSWSSTLLQSIGASTAVSSTK